MKIILVGVFNYNSTSPAQADGLRKNNVNVIEFDFRKIATTIGDYERDKQLVEICKIEKPDAIIFCKCNEIMGWVVSECNKICKTVLWYMDPLNSNFNNTLIEKIKLCNLTFCALQEPFKEAKKIGDDKVFFLHEGYDQTSNYPVCVI